LAYAVTVHKSQGLTVDRALVVVDGATSGEHLYVGMTRGRHLNQACVVCEPQGDEHQQHPAPSAHDVLSGALRRSSSESSATETLRAGVDRTVDSATLQATLAEARRQIDAAAGPDRTTEIRVLRQQAAKHGQLVDRLAEAQTELARQSDQRDGVRSELAQARHDLRAAQERRGLWRRPDRSAQTAAEAAQRRATNRLTVIDDNILQTETLVSRLRQECEQARHPTDLLRKEQRAQQQRTAWLQAHPDVVEHIKNLSEQLRQAIQQERILRRASASRAAAGRLQTSRRQLGNGATTAAHIDSAYRMDL
jgi:hypothetical protein